MEKKKIDWEPYDGGFIGSRLMPDGICNFIYHIYPNSDGTYSASASNNAYGAERVAIKNKKCKAVRLIQQNDSNFNFCINMQGSKYKESELESLMKKIEDGKCLWLYTWYCNCVGEVTTKEY